MTSDLKVGDRVQYQRRGHMKGTFVTGVILKIADEADEPYAVIKSDKGGYVYPALHKLTKIEAVSP